MHALSFAVRGVRKDRGQSALAAIYVQSVCAVYDCCKNGKKLKNCGACQNLPCEKFTKDPTISDEQNAANLEKMMARLKGNK